MTKQIDIPTGKLLLAELQEFGTFSAEAQRYIRRSLAIAFGRGDPLVRWARDDDEATHILAQMQVYASLDRIRDEAHCGVVFASAEAFATLVAVSQFDLCEGKLEGFAPYRFLYERLMGGAVRPWLPSVFCAVAAMPNLEPKKRAALFTSLGDALTTRWSHAEATFYPEWIDCLTVDAEA